MTGPDGYDSALTAIRDNVEDLGDRDHDLGARDDTKPDAHARRCRIRPVDAIDTSLQALHTIRQC